MRKYLALALLFLAASAASAAAESWPERPVKVIVGFAPGGPTDLVARLIAQKLTQATGKNFFIENIGGAGGNIGTLKAAQSPPTATRCW
jgi:tripartite-type tricarboxylate transporter receptor subunit TctC